jgi:dTMP kinase
VSRGRLITLEGIEGAGKSTVARFVGEWLGARGLRVVLTREPGGTALAERVRNIVLEPADEILGPQAELLLMFAARAIHVANLIRPALERGDWVVCDRFTDATRAYQGAGRGLEADLIERLALCVHGDLAPDCTLLLDVTVKAGLERARRRSAADRFEQERQPFFERVRAEYLRLAAREPRRIRVIDAARPLEAVQRDVAATLDSVMQAGESS